MEEEVVDIAAMAAAVATFSLYDVSIAFWYSRVLRSWYFQRVSFST